MKGVFSTIQCRLGQKDQTDASYQSPRCATTNIKPCSPLLWWLVTNLMQRPISRKGRHQRCSPIINKETESIGSTIIESVRDAALIKRCSLGKLYCQTHRSNRRGEQGRERERELPWNDKKESVLACKHARMHACMFMVFMLSALIEYTK